MSYSRCTDRDGGGGERRGGSSCVAIHVPSEGGWHICEWGRLVWKEGKEKALVYQDTSDGIGWQCATDGGAETDELAAGDHSGQSAANRSG